MLKLIKRVAVDLSKIVVPPTNSGSRLPFLKIPNGYPHDDKRRCDLWEEADSRLTRAELTQFFTPEVLRERLIVCPTMNVDVTDDLGVFGYEPGFIFIQQGQIMNRAPVTINEAHWINGSTLRLVETPTGLVIPVLPHKDFMPRNSEEIKFQEVRHSQNPNTFHFLCEVVFGEAHYPSKGEFSAKLNAKGKNQPRDTDAVKLIE
jgi:hypothetical protein